jgi:PKD repeat protein
MKNKFALHLLLAITVLVFASCTEDSPLPATNACFEFSPAENIQVGDTLYFTNCSEESESYNWSFGDGENSVETEPFHIYTEPGTYDVVLVASNGSVVNSTIQSISVSPVLGYIINYGDYSGDKTTISAYDLYDDEVTNNHYKNVNGVDMISNVQYAYDFNNNIYFLGNSADQLFWVDNKTFVQTENAITTDIVKPRYCVGNGDYLYVSCWGGDIWADETLSYIAKVNISTNAVEGKIALSGGPEGLAIANGKLYAALNYKDSVAVVDLSSEAISYIETPAVSSFFVKDGNHNLYVSLVSTYSDYSDKTGLGYINTTTDKLEVTYDLAGVSTSYVNIMAANSNFSKIYVMTTVYDANWNLSGAVATFDVSSKSFESNNLVEGISGINGIAFYNDKVFCFLAESVTGNGLAKTYSEDGIFVKEYETGIAPFMMLSVE